MLVPSEPIGSIPRRDELITAMRTFSHGELTKGEMDSIFESEVRSTIEEFEATGSPVITDGEQSKPSFVSYPIAGLKNLASGGVTILFRDGHSRQLPTLGSGGRFVTKRTLPVISKLQKNMRMFQ